MRLCVAYTAVCGGKLTTSHAARFISTWMQYPPFVQTDLVVICNGGQLTTEQAIMFSSLKARFFPRSNEGWDLGGYVEASKGILADYDMVLFCGESIHFWKAGWLDRLAAAWKTYGPSMLGIFGSHVIRAHLQTTAFATSPKLLSEYQLSTLDRKGRYEAEHGERAFWRRVWKCGYPVRLITWSGEWSPGQWRLPKNGLWSGDQSDLLFFCNHSQRWAEADNRRKRSWTASANRPFK